MTTKLSKVRQKIKDLVNAWWFEMMEQQYEATRKALETHRQVVLDEAIEVVGKDLDEMNPPENSGYHCRECGYEGYNTALKEIRQLLEDMKEGEK